MTILWKLKKDPRTNKCEVAWRKLENGNEESCLVTNEQFKRQINEETAQLQDADGNLMSAQQAKAYVATLP